ncbi:MAG: PqqD family protein [Sulfurovum sp.]|nr:PqqD family protein [Sulfurovum sp.]
MNPDQKITFAETVFAQEVDGEMVLLDMNSENYFGLDAVGTDIWNLLSEGKTIGETQKALLEMYDVDVNTLEKDIEDFIGKLVENELAVVA